MRQTYFIYYQNHDGIYPILKTHLKKLANDLYDLLEPFGAKIKRI